MFRSARRLSLPAAAIAVLALAAPAGSAAVDYRSPDSKAAAIEARSQDSVDLRSPDARDAGQVAQSPPRGDGDPRSLRASTGATPPSAPEPCSGCC